MQIMHNTLQARMCSDPTMGCPRIAFRHVTSVGHARKDDRDRPPLEATVAGVPLARMISKIRPDANHAQHRSSVDVLRSDDGLPADRVPTRYEKSRLRREHTGHAAHDVP